ncbi:hypothetical protein [Rhodopila sp.]|uniref:hypothetical protein n=1 Tax=Rhodopila sp. TaxID=2480087 RepID=UPI003D0C1569
MKKITSTRSARLKRRIVDVDLRNTRPLRVPGATITAWPAAAEPDPASLAAEPARGATVAGSGSIVALSDEDPMADQNQRGAVLLSDGTRITFDMRNRSDTD